MAHQAEMRLDSEIIAGSDLLLDCAHPGIYAHNAFRILELPVEATPREIMKRQQMIEMARKTGMPIPPGPARYLPLDPPPDEYAVRQAVQRLQDPERRMVDELFWFWPHNLGQSKADSGLQALVQGDVKGAETIWADQAMMQSEGYVSKHNLAVLAHLSALGKEEEAGDRDKGQDGDDLDHLWEKTYKYWKEVINYEGFWSRVSARIREMNDPRLTTGVARRMRSSLPTALLSINARLGVMSAEQGDLDTAKRHKAIIQAPGWVQELEDALHRAVEPVRSRIDILCKTSGENADDDPVHADKAAQRLLDHARPLLRVLDCMMPGDHATRVHAHDEVALKVRLCQITFAKKTEDWKASLGLLEQALPLAVSDSTRMRVEEDLKIVQGNISGSWWCGEGYYDLPKQVLDRMEEARAKADSENWDEAIRMLKDLLTGKSNMTLEEGSIPLIRKSLGYCLNVKGVRLYNKAWDEYNEPLSLLERRPSNSLVNLAARVFCEVCGDRIYGSYMQITYRNTPLDLCMGCHGSLEREREERKKVLAGKLKEASDELMMARSLDPDSKLIEDNCTGVSNSARENGVSLSKPIMLLMNAGLMNMPALILALGDEENEVRAAASKALVRMGIKAAPELINVLAQDKRWTARQSAAHALGNMPQEAQRSIPVLIASLKDEHASVRQEAVLALDKLGNNSTEVVTALIDVLVDKKEGVRKAVKNALNRLNPRWAATDAAKRLLAELIRELENDLAERRLIAAEALGKMGPAAGEAIRDLVKVLGDTDAGVRWAVQEALSEIGREAVPALIASLKSGNPGTVMAVIESLREMAWAASEAVPALTDLYETGDRVLKDAIILALWRIDMKAADRLLARQKRKKEMLRWAVGFAVLILAVVLYNLYHSGWPSAVYRMYRYGLIDKTKVVSALSENLKEGVDRKSTIETLGKIGPAAKDAVPALIVALKEDEDISVRISAAEALGEIGPAAKDAVLALIVASKEDRDSSVRESAAVALGKIGRAAAKDVVSLWIVALKESKEDFSVNLSLLSAAEELGEIGRAAAKDVVPLLIVALKEDEDSVRISAAKALGKIGRAAAKDVVPLLIVALKEDEDSVRISAAEALGEIGPAAKDAVPTLERIQNDVREYKAVREAISEAIAAINKTR